jgi:hypothetical protein
MLDLAPARLFFVTLFVAILFAPGHASAISVEIARKCQALASKAHPAARVGAKTGTAREHLAYYRDCGADNENPQKNDALKSAAPPAK